MNPTDLFRWLPRPRQFLRFEADLHSNAVQATLAVLPEPQFVPLADEPGRLGGFPVLESQQSRELSEALTGWLELEEKAQVAVARRVPADLAGLQRAWARYATLLGGITENTLLWSYGRYFPAIFWLFHSETVARQFKEIPRRLLQIDLDVGRRQGNAIKYRILNRYLERVLSLSYDLANRLASATEEREEDLFPRLLIRMRDNVLVLSEDHISPDLSELSSYFNGYLGIRAREFLARIEALKLWHRQQLDEDPELAAAARLVVHDESFDPDALIFSPRYVDLLRARRDYDSTRMLDDTQIELWQNLSQRLQEFELIRGFRQSVVRVRKQGADLVTDGTGRRQGKEPHRLASTTRPMDFTSPWVLDPLVNRCGLIYDITDFSEVVTLLQRVDAEAQTRSLHSIFTLQRRIRRHAVNRGLKLEKYLGDGAFFSGRAALPALATAVEIQRLYRQALREDFLFDRGLRIALNSGRYRLLPIEAESGTGGQRYEFFGHGLVELSRLVTGKATHEIDEIANQLVSLGYPLPSVERFFAPLRQNDVDVVDRQEEQRDFFAYINRNGTLINEGIVATSSFLMALDRERAFSVLYQYRDGGRSYVATYLPAGTNALLIGFRRLGNASLKGLGPTTVFELVDGADWDRNELEEIAELDLLRAIDQSFTMRRHTTPASGE